MSVDECGLFSYPCLLYHNRYGECVQQQIFAPEDGREGARALRADLRAGLDGGVVPPADDQCRPSGDFTRHGWGAGGLG